MIDLENKMFKMISRDFYELGYRNSQLVREFRTINKRYIPDVVILDEETNLPKICFELKIGNKRRESILKAINGMKYLYKEFISLERFFIVYWSKEKERNEYYDISKIIINDLIDVKEEIDNIMKGITTDIFAGNYDGLLIKTHSIYKNKPSNNLNFIKNDLNANRNNELFKIVSIIIAVIVMFAIIVLDAIGLYIVTYERLILIGMFVIILLLPFISEVSYKDFSLKINKAKDK